MTGGGHLQLVPQGSHARFQLADLQRTLVVLQHQPLGGVSDLRGQHAGHAPERVFDHLGALVRVHAADEPASHPEAVGHLGRHPLGQRQHLVARQLVGGVVDADLGVARIPAQVRVQHPPVPLQRPLQPLEPPLIVRLARQRPPEIQLNRRAPRLRRPHPGRPHRRRWSWSCVIVIVVVPMIVVVVVVTVVVVVVIVVVVPRRVVVVRRGRDRDHGRAMVVLRTPARARVASPATGWEGSSSLPMR